ncbi:hypothetical protein C1X05_03005 [Laceyella sacchari]|uniref:Uncharacterized protein n=1 Tax=Laceyella tengchongensis TaxID=574699 RepID=A0AA45WIJ9_9BACL|nr:hypothetical protein [Laceyella tengchongensis]AUS07895.1 hypothetical protein C1X05_03005 [Laceyella sacchari]SMP00583.1 hypothetical protein SAMN06265361_101119 [Laceyella tengchongensis]
MSRWDQWEMEAKIREVLQAVENDRGESHHFGRPLFTAYQIAIAIGKRYPGFLEETGMEIGGEGSESSLARYIAQQLSMKIKEGAIEDMEGFLLAADHVKEIDFIDPSRAEFEANVTNDISLFRIKE